MPAAVEGARRGKLPRFLFIIFPRRPTALSRTFCSAAALRGAFSSAPRSVSCVACANPGTAMISASSAFHRCPWYTEWPGAAPRPTPHLSISAPSTGIPSVNGGLAGAGPPLGTLAQPEGLAPRPTIPATRGIPGLASPESPQSHTRMPARSTDEYRNNAIRPLPHAIPALFLARSAGPRASR